MLPFSRPAARLPFASTATETTLFVAVIVKFEVLAAVSGRLYWNICAPALSLPTYRCSGAGVGDGVGDGVGVGVGTKTPVLNGGGAAVPPLQPAASAANVTIMKKRRNIRSTSGIASAHPRMARLRGIRLPG